MQLAEWSECTFEHELPIPDRQKPGQNLTALQRKYSAVVRCVRNCRFAKNGLATCVHPTEQEKVHGIHWKKNFKKAISGLDTDEQMKLDLDTSLEAITGTNYLMDNIRQASGKEYRGVLGGEVARDIFELYDFILPEIMTWKNSQEILQLLDELLAMIGICRESKDWTIFPEEVDIDQEEMTEKIRIIKELLRVRYEQLVLIVRVLSSQSA